jgi:hypothetical protein
VRTFWVDATFLLLAFIATVIPPAAQLSWILYDPEKHHHVIM